MNKITLKKIALLVTSVIIIIGLFAFFSVSDLLPEDYKKHLDQAKGKQLLIEMGQAHSIDSWDAINTYSVTFEEEFLAFVGKATKPFKNDRTKFRLDYILDSYDGKFTFLDGDLKGQQWGMQSWKTYKQPKEQSVTFKQDANITFWLPTYQYFIEFPRAIQQATAVAYVGTKEINGVTCKGVLASWGTIEKQRDIDQYLIWLHPDTKRIVQLEYTVREMYSFLTGGAFYTAYKDYNGVLLPSIMPVISNLVNDGYLHEMRILDFKVNTVSTASLRPDTLLEITSNKPE